MDASLNSSLVEKELRSLADPVKARLLAGFFKTGKGEYGEGDIFLGITVPVQRRVAKKFCALYLSKVDQFEPMVLMEVGKLLASPIHECRLTALEILVMQYERAKRDENISLQRDIVAFYLKHTKHINNWDLVDASAPYILGDWLLDHDRPILYELVYSKNIWERRIAIISTFAFIRVGQLEDSLRLARILLKDEHDLIHKAVGWMLREVGKRDEKVLVRFLNAHATKMPRTMLRYAIERFPEDKRLMYLNVGK